MLKLIYITVLYGLLPTDGAAPNNTSGFRGEPDGMSSMQEEHSGIADHPAHNFRRASIFYRIPSEQEPPNVNHNHISNPQSPGPLDSANPVQYQPGYNKRHQFLRNPNNQQAAYRGPIHHNFIPSNVRADPNIKNLNGQNPYQQVPPNTKVKPVKQDLISDQQVFEHLPTKENGTHITRWKPHPRMNPNRRTRNSQQRPPSIQHNFIPPDVQANPHTKNLNGQNRYQQVPTKNKVKPFEHDFISDQQLLEQIPTPENRTRILRWMQHLGMNPNHRPQNSERRSQPIKADFIQRNRFWPAQSNQYTQHPKGVKRFRHKRYDTPQYPSWMGTRGNPIQGSGLTVEPIRPVRNPHKLIQHDETPENMRLTRHVPNLAEEVPINYIPTTRNEKKSRSQNSKTGPSGNVKYGTVNGSMYRIRNPIQEDQDPGDNKASTKKPAQQAKTFLEHKPQPLKFAAGSDTEAPDQHESTSPKVKPEHQNSTLESQPSDQNWPHESIPSTTGKPPLWKRGISAIKGFFTRARDLAIEAMGLSIHRQRRRNKNLHKSNAKAAHPEEPHNLQPHVPVTGHMKNSQPQTGSVNESLGTLGISVRKKHKLGKDAIQETTTRKLPLWKRGVSAIKGFLTKAKALAKGAIGLPVDSHESTEDVNQDQPTTPITQPLRPNVQMPGNVQHTLSQMGSQHVSIKDVLPDQETSIKQQPHPRIQQNVSAKPTFPSTPKPTVKSGLLSKLDKAIKRLLFF